MRLVAWFRSLRLELFQSKIKVLCIFEARSDEEVLSMRKAEFGPHSRH